MPRPAGPCLATPNPAPPSPAATGWKGGQAGRRLRPRLAGPHRRMSAQLEQPFTGVRIR
jgi:hypothetical protein